jgi:hypothetical protein
MQYVKWLQQIIFQKNFWNIILLIGFFPSYLYIIKANQLLFSSFGIIGFLILVAYLVFLYRYRIRSYQIPLHFILASILFMRVIKGDTVPIAAIVIVLGLGLFFVQDIISHKEYRSSEFMRQIIISGSIFVSFSTYAFLFGSIFIGTTSPIILSIIAFISTLNISLYILWMYGVDREFYRIMSFILSLVIVELFIGLRVLPLTHLTQSIILTTFLIFSLSIFRDIYLRVLNTKKIIARTVLISILLGLLVFTSLV